MPTRCNRGFSLQILLLAQHVSGTTMPIIRSSRVLYSSCCLWYFVLWFSSCWSGVELRVMCPVCRMLQHPANQTHNPKHVEQAIRSAIKPLLHLVGILFPHINDDARSKSHQNFTINFICANACGNKSKNTSFAQPLPDSIKGCVPRKFRHVGFLHKLEFPSMPISSLHLSYLARMKDYNSVLQKCTIKRLR